MKNLFSNTIIQHVNIYFTLVFLLILMNIVYSQAIILDDLHAISSSIETHVDSENVYNDDTQNYDKKYAFLSKFSLAYIYNQKFELKLTYLNSTDEGNFAFQVSQNTPMLGLSISYYIKNIIRKASISQDMSVSDRFDFNLNFVLDYGSAIKGNQNYNGYGIGFSTKVEGDKYSSFPKISYIQYEYSNSLLETIKVPRLIFELPTKIEILPKDNIPSNDGFWISPVVTLHNLSDAYFGMIFGMYHNF